MAGQTLGGIDGSGRVVEVESGAERGARPEVWENICLPFLAPSHMIEAL